MNLENVIEICRAKKTGGGDFLGHCPAHDDKSPSLSIKYNETTDQLLFNCFAGCAFDQIIKSLNKSIPDESFVSYGSKKSNTTFNIAEELIKKGLSLTPDCISSKYLKNRGLTVHSNLECLFHLDKNPYYADAILVGNHPALGIKITDKADKTVGVQAIFLGEDGNKANVEIAKKIFGSISGHSVKLKGSSDGSIHLCEGLETGLAIHESINGNVFAVLSASNLANQEIPQGVSDVHIWADKDKSLAGQKASEKAATKYFEEGFSVYIHEIKDEIPDDKKGIDWLDIFNSKGRDSLKLELQDSKAFKVEWSNLIDLPSRNVVSPSLTDEFLPASVNKFVFQNAKALGVPAEFIAIPLLVTLSSLIGRKVQLLPKANNMQWRVVSNLWGAIVGRPSSKKSPSMSSVLKHINKLDAQIRERHESGIGKLIVEKEIIDQQVQNLKNSLKQKGSESDINNLKKKLLELYEQKSLLQKAIEPPRIMTSSSTLEKLQSIISHNPNGILLFRDELAGFIKEFDKKGHESDRAFYLESWDGNGSYTHDTLSRGAIHAEGLCLSIIGTTQPGKLWELISNAKNGKGAADGFIQRFQLLVFPEEAHFKPSSNIIIDPQLEELIFHLMSDLYHLKIDSFENNSSEKNIELLSFTENAQKRFDQWLHDFEHRIITEHFESEAFEEHLGKYRSLVPSLALIFHLVSRTTNKNLENKVGINSLELSLKWLDFLEGHAKKVYSISEIGKTSVAQLLVKKIKAHQIYDKMTVRELSRRGWSDLKDEVLLEEALELLELHNFIRVEKNKHENGGRVSKVIRINPCLLEGGSHV
jgi:DNA-binding PadR family transcriptional regulator